MRRIRKEILGGVALMLASCGPVSLTRGAIPMSCEVNLSSQKGGQIRVATIDKSPSVPIEVPPQISWDPVSADSSMKLRLKFQNAPWSGENSVVGGFLRFPVPSTVNVASYEVVISTKSGGDYRYMSEKDFSELNGLIDISLDDKSKYGQDILAYINKGQDISVKVLNGEKQISFVIFKTSEIAERDKLFSEAGRLLTASKSKVCRPLR